MSLNLQDSVQHSSSGTSESSKKHLSKESKLGPYSHSSHSSDSSDNSDRNSGDSSSIHKRKRRGGHKKLKDKKEDKKEQKDRQHKDKKGKRKDKKKHKRKKKSKRKSSSESSDSDTDLGRSDEKSKSGLDMMKSNKRARRFSPDRSGGSDSDTVKYKHAHKYDTSPSDRKWDHDLFFDNELGISRPHKRRG